MVVGAKWAGLSISETVDEKKKKKSVGFTGNEKICVSCSSVNKNDLLIPEVRGEWSDCLS